MSRRFVFGSVLAVGVVLIGCLGAAATVGRHSGTDLGEIDEAEARAALDRTVALVNDGDFGQLCEAAAGHANDCRWWLERVGWRSAPLEYPAIVSSTRLEPDGWLFELCGQTAAGESYLTGFAVYPPEGATIDVPYPVYWSGLRVADAGGVIPGVNLPASDCPRS